MGGTATILHKERSSQSCNACLHLRGVELHLLPHHVQAEPKGSHLGIPDSFRRPTLRAYGRQLGSARAGRRDGPELGLPNQHHYDRRHGKAPNAICSHTANSSGRAIESASTMDTILPIISIRSGIGEISQYILSGQRMHTVQDKHSFSTTLIGS